jgi:hypothetical protein
MNSEESLSNFLFREGVLVFVYESFLHFLLFFSK